VHAGFAVLIALAFALAGAGVDAARNTTDLTSVFSVAYVVGCVLAVLFVRYHGLFTAAVQPPLIMFLVVPGAYQYMTKSGTSMKDLALNDAVPLVNRFPLMATATIAVLALAGVRLLMNRGQTASARPRRAGAASAARKAGSGKAKPDTVKDKLDRIQSKAGTLKAQSGQPKGEPTRGRRPESGEWQQRGYPERPQQSGPARGGQRPDPRGDPRYGGSGYPQGAGAQQRQNMPQHQSRPQNPRYRGEHDPYDR
jgi:hypothetical protein